MIKATISFESGTYTEKEYESEECIETIMLMLENQKFVELGGLIVRSDEVKTIKYKEVK